jgi:hypothetical protein
VIKPRKIKFPGHVPSMREIRNAYKILFVEDEEKILFRREGNI